MTNPIKQTIWLLITIITLAASGWYFASSKNTASLSEEALATTRDALVYDLVVKQFNANGQLINLLKTPVVEHIPQSNVHFFTSPTILTKQDDGEYWHIKADTARALHGSAKIIFDKNVKAIQSSINGDKIFTTDNMIYLPKEKLAYTEAKIYYQEPGNTLESEGARLDLADKKIQLLSKARGSYTPKHG